MAEDEQAWENKDRVCMCGIKGSGISELLASTLACSSPGPPTTVCPTSVLNALPISPARVTSKPQAGLDGI